MNADMKPKSYKCPRGSKMNFESESVFDEVKTGVSMSWDKISEVLEIIVNSIENNDE